MGWSRSVGVGIKLKSEGDWFKPARRLASHKNPTRYEAPGMQ